MFMYQKFISMLKRISMLISYISNVCMHINYEKQWLKHYC